MGKEFNPRTILMIVVGFLLVRGLLSLVNGIDAQDILDTLLILPGLVLGLTIHEFAHAKAADKLGDPTPERLGRLTLNPLAHLDPIGTVCLLLAGFGWGKPVIIDPSYYREPAKDSAKVAFAGPLSNFIMAFILFLLYALAYSGIPTNTFTKILQAMLFLGAYINLSLAVFNLLPFPPLDGSKIFGYFLKGKAKAFLWTLERYSTYILIILFITGIPSMIITPVVNGIAYAMNTAIEKLFLAIW